jgi:hypothetical protein
MDILCLDLTIVLSEITFGSMSFIEIVGYSYFQKLQELKFDRMILYHSGNDETLEVPSCIFCCLLGTGLCCMGLRGLHKLLVIFWLIIWSLCYHTENIRWYRWYTSITILIHPYVHISYVVLFYLKLFKNKKGNIACWCEPHVNKLVAHPWLGMLRSVPKVVI